jgi:glycosyltransferase involved in cell wall biosynthesis
MSRTREPRLLSVVAPAYNESTGVEAFVRAIDAALDGVVGEWEIVIVDDGSADDTWRRIDAVADEHPRVRGIKLSRNFGKEGALAAGLRAAAGDVIVTIDADLQHPPSVIPSMVERWREGYDVVDGVKRSRTGQSPLHRLVSATFNRAFGWMTGVDLTDATDFKLLDRQALDALLRLDERAHFYRGTAEWIGFDRVAVPFSVDERVAGSSRWRLTSLASLALTAVTAFTAKPLHLVTLGGLGFLVFAMVLGVQTLVRFVSGTAVEGFTTVILLLLLMGGLILMGLGIIGEYLARIHEEVKRRPRYIVAAETTELDELPGSAG